MVQDLVKINRALVSVSDKTGLVDFVAELYQANPNIEIISSGGTAKVIRAAGYPVMDISDYTRYPESPDGLVKTLHPKVHGGLLLEPDKGPHKEYMKKRRIKPVNLVVVNLYPFEKTVARGADIEEAREQIDIGGPSMLRSAAKGYKWVTALVDPADYEKVLVEMKSTGGTSLGTRYELAGKVFQVTSAYDAAISEFLHKHSKGEAVRFYLG